MALTLAWTREIPKLDLGNDWRVLIEVLRNPSAFLLKLSCKAGRIAQFAAGPVRIVLVNQPELISSLLVEHAGSLRKMAAIKSLGVFTGEGLLINEGDLWAKHRKLVAPAFHHRRIQFYQQMTSEIVDAAQRQWQHGQVIDLQQEFKRLSLRIIGKALFSIDLEEIAHSFATDIGIALNYVNLVAAQAALPLSRYFLPGRGLGEAAIRRVDAIVYELIRQRRGCAHDQDHGDFLSMLLLSNTAEGDHLSDQEVRDEAITMFVAGHETISAVLTWLHYHVARQPMLQEALQREAYMQLGGRTPLLADMANLPLAQQTYKEALRMYPSGFTIGRQTTHEIDLCGYRIPANTWVMVSPYSAHRNPEIFDSPEEFRPERFTPEREQALPRGGYLPFGLGPRTCIGSAFAMMEGQIIVSHLAQHVRLCPLDSQPVNIAPMITLNPDRPILMRVERICPH